MGHVFIATLTFIQTIDEYDYILKGGGAKPNIWGEDDIFSLIY